MKAENTSLGAFKVDVLGVSADDVSLPESLKSLAMEGTVA